MCVVQDESWLTSEPLLHARKQALKPLSLGSKLIKTIKGLKAGMQLLCFVSLQLYRSGSPTGPKGIRLHRELAQPRMKAKGPKIEAPIM